MKTLKTFLLMAALLVFAIPAFAQLTDPAEETPDWAMYFVDMGILAATSVPLTAFIILKIGGGLAAAMKQILAWVVTIALAFVGYFMNWGALVELNALGTALFGLGAGVIANLGYDQAIVKYVLTLIGLKVKLTKN